MAKLKDVCELMDKQFISLLELIEKDVANKVYLEKQMNSGNLLIAKTRYIKVINNRTIFKQNVLTCTAPSQQGQQTVSANQLPGEDSAEFKALSTVERESNGHWSLEKKHPVDKDKGYIEPSRWFGVLVPQSLQLAKDKFRNCLFLIVEGANIRINMQQKIRQLLHLKTLKFEMQQEN